LPVPERQNVGRARETKHFQRWHGDCTEEAMLPLNSFALSLICLSQAVATEALQAVQARGQRAAGAACDDDSCSCESLSPGLRAE
jgi:hypothetical protein